MPPAVPESQLSTLKVRDDELFDEDVSAEDHGDVNAASAGVSVAPVLSVGPVASSESVAPVPSVGPEAPSESVAPVPSVGPEVPSDADFPDFAQRKRGRKTFAALVASAVVLVGAGGAWSQFASRGKAPSAGVAARTPERRAPDRTPEPVSPQPAPPPVAPVPSEAVSAPATKLEGAVGTSPEKALTTVAVTIKTVPEEAVIFRAGQRLGAGVVEVNVERNTKQRFTALHDGYSPSNFTLDGSRDSITIRLKRTPKREAAPAPENDLPYGDQPNVDSSTATASAPTAAPTTAVAPTAAPAATTAPAPENTPPPPPSPDVTSPVTSPE